MKSCRNLTMKPAGKIRYGFTCAGLRPTIKGFPDLLVKKSNSLDFWVSRFMFMHNSNSSIKRIWNLRITKMVLDHVHSFHVCQVLKGFGVEPFCEIQWRCPHHHDFSMKISAKWKKKKIKKKNKKRKKIVHWIGNLTCA